VESSSDPLKMEHEILLIKKQYTSAYEFFMSSKNHIAYYAVQEIGTIFDDSSQNIVQAQKEISEGKNELARLALHLAEAHLQNAKKKIEVRAKRRVI
jgi:hypothetical protein